MTIQQVKSKVTSRDLGCLTVHLQTTLTPYPLRLVAIGREYLTVLNEGKVLRIDPLIVTEIRM